MHGLAANIFRYASIRHNDEDPKQLEDQEDAFEGNHHLRVVEECTSTPPAASTRPRSRVSTSTGHSAGWDSAQERIGNFRLIIEFVSPHTEADDNLPYMGGKDLVSGGSWE